MSKDTVFIYVDPAEDIERYPDSLLGDMSVFTGFRSEVQWLFYLMLKDQGMDIRISRDIPKVGIFVIFKGNVRKFVWNPDLFVVSAQWDYPRDDRAQVHLVSNQYKSTNAALGWLDRLSFPGLQYYLPPITHPVIIARDSSRGDRFENITFIGDPRNLDEPFKTDAFEKRLQALGMSFTLNSDPDIMADFSDVDAVIAIRKIGKVIKNKPPAKLINAWRGGVPSLLGCEIGFRELRQSEFDYIEVDSVEDVVNGLSRLKTDIEFRRKMMENGHERASGFTAAEQTQRWNDFFKNSVIPDYHAWQRRSALSKWTFLYIRWLRELSRRSASYVWHQLLSRPSKNYQ